MPSPPSSPSSSTDIDLDLETAVVGNAHVARVAKKNEVNLVNLSQSFGQVCDARRIRFVHIQPEDIHISDTKARNHFSGSYSSGHSFSSASTYRAPSPLTSHSYISSPTITMYNRQDDEGGTLLQRQRCQEGNQIPTPSRPMRASRYIPKHKPPVSVEKLRQNFQASDERFTPPSVTPTQKSPKLQTSSMQLPAPSGYIHRARLPPQRRVATTPTTNLTSISEAHVLPPSRTFSSFEYGTSPLERYERTSYALKTMSSNEHRLPISGSHLRRSSTASHSLVGLENYLEEPVKQFAYSRRTSSKIPSPMKNSNRQSTIRFVSTPVLPSEKENVPPRGLLRPISPTQKPLPVMPKSRTTGLLSSISTTLARPHLSLHSRQSLLSTSHSSLSLTKTSSSGFLQHTAAPTTAVSELYAEPVHASIFSSKLGSRLSRSKLQQSSSTIITDPRQVDQAQAAAFWCGRFQALKDRYMTELMQGAMKDPEKYHKLLGPFSQEEIEDQERIEKKTNYGRLLDEHNNIENAGLSPSTFVQVKEDRVALRAFKEIQELCTSKEARESFWWWQLRYARLEKKEYYLPKGGTMKDSWVSQKAGQFLKTQRDDMGRKTSFGSRIARTRADNRSRIDLMKY